MTSEALTQAFLDRIAAGNPRYNAIIFLDPDALADARAIDARRPAGAALGPLAGVPVVVKDPMDMVGFTTTAGWSRLHSGSGGVDSMPGTDSPVVARRRGRLGAGDGKPLQQREYGHVAAWRSGGVRVGRGRGRLVRIGW